MVSLGSRSFWTRTHSCSQRVRDGDVAGTATHGVAERVADGEAHDKSATQPSYPAKRDEEVDDVDDDDDDDDDDAEERPGQSSDQDDNSPIASTTPSSQTPTTPPESITMSATPTTAATSDVTWSSTSPPMTLIPITLTATGSSAPTIWITNSKASSISTYPTLAATTALPLAVSVPSVASPSPPSEIFRTGGENDDDCCRVERLDRLPSHNKVGIALGTIGGIAFAVGLLWLAVLIRRRRKRRGQDTLSPEEYASSVGKSSWNHFNFRWPTLPLQRSRSDSETSPQTFWPFKRARRPSSGTRRSHTSIMDDAMRAAYGSDNASLHSATLGHPGEKRNDRLPLPILDPTPITQATIRHSLASWFRRSRSAHPLGLNPNSRWSRSTTRSTATSADTESRYTPSIYSTYGTTTDDELVPPMPNLDLQRSYKASSTQIATPAVDLPVPKPIFARALTDSESPMPDKSHWSHSTGSGVDHARMSSVSSRTDATQTTISGGRESIPAMPGTTVLSPPVFHRATLSAERSASAELQELYEQGARPSSAVGAQRDENSF